MGADLAGFAAAQQRLRGQFGEAAVFLQAPVFTYPGGTPIDPDTGAPYDPVITPTSSAQASATVNVNVAFEAYRAGRDRDDQPGAIGFVDRAHIMLIADLQDRSQCEGAISVLVREQLYKVTAMKVDGIGQLQRWLTFARKGTP